VRAAVVVAAVLLLAYIATLAPGVTFWDAGEFIAAARTLGIPHPPGTPLYILLAHVWAGVLPWLGTAAASNLLSAVCAAAACGLLAALLARLTGDEVAAIAGGIVAGAMSSVWLSATETEVYTVAVLLACAMLWCGERVGRTGSRRWAGALVYLMALAVPLHLSALVAAPAAIALATESTSGERRWRDAVMLAGAFVAAAGLGLVSGWLVAVGLVMLAAGALGARPRRVAELLMWVLLLLLGASAILVLLLRARHDPAINQGDPSTWGALLDVVGRRQYAVAPLWPRQAPLWLQLSNLLEYADWQVALGLAPGVAPSPWRTPVTLLFAALGVAGARAHRRADARGWRALLILLLCGSLGVALQLNLKAGASFGYGILPDDAPHEARERDYFFLLAWLVWGLWAGLGAVTAVRGLWARRGWRFATPAALAVAAIPLVLNWRATDRRRAPDAELARTFAVAMLEAAPARAVLFAWGDNDTYPLWYAQTVEGLRRDVTLVTVPLLPADWYRRELVRRTELLDSADAAAWLGQGHAVRTVARNARRFSRPIAASLTIPAESRRTLGGAWTLRGLLYVEGTPAGPIDSAAAAAERRVAGLLDGPPPKPATDPTVRLMHRLLECPRLARRAAGGEDVAVSLDSLCNYR
jgi:hypothetical protein